VEEGDGGSSPVESNRFFSMMDRLGPLSFFHLEKWTESGSRIHCRPGSDLGFQNCYGLSIGSVF
jgi:hypothetical protein